MENNEQGWSTVDIPLMKFNEMRNLSPAPDENSEDSLQQRADRVLDELLNDTKDVPADQQHLNILPENREDMTESTEGWTSEFNPTLSRRTNLAAGTVDEFMPEGYSVESTRELMQFLEEWQEECEVGELTEDEQAVIDRTINALRRVAAQREQGK